MSVFSYSLSNLSLTLSLRSLLGLVLERDKRVALWQFSFLVNNNNLVLVYLPLEATHRAGTTLATPPLSLIHKDYHHHHHIHILVSKSALFFSFIQKRNRFH